MPAPPMPPMPMWFSAHWGSRISVEKELAALLAVNLHRSIAPCCLLRPYMGMMPYFEESMSSHTDMGSADLVVLLHRGVSRHLG